MEKALPIPVTFEFGHLVGVRRSYRLSRLTGVPSSLQIIETWAPLIRKLCHLGYLADGIADAAQWESWKRVFSYLV